MKVTKRLLKKIIKEEKTKLLEQSRASSEGNIQAELASIIDAVQELSDGLYGLQDPGDPGVAAGDEMAQDLALQVERLNKLFDQLESYFLTIDDMAGRNPGGSIG